MSKRLAACCIAATALLSGSTDTATGACGVGCSKPTAAQGDTMPKQPDPADKLKGHEITETGLTPVFPQDFECPPLTSLYASWIDVDGSRRDEIHSGVDAGRLGDPILSPAPGTVRRVWIADWGQGIEGALLMRHTREDLNLKDGPKFYYIEYDHLRYADIQHLKEGQKIARGEQLARVYRPGGKQFFLPEVHFEVWEVGDDTALTWQKNEHGTEFFKNATARLIDPLYLMSREVPPTADGEVTIQPFDPERDYGKFKGLTYFIACRKRAM